MYVDILLEPARQHLATVADTAPLLEAARLLRPNYDLVVICGADGVMDGVVSKTDVVAQMSHCKGESCVCAVATVMTRDVLACRVGDQLAPLWSRMRERGFKNVPLVDSADRPIGVVTARDMLQVLLRESENEELLLRDYVMGFGYR
jgi:CBS-domain-containing membrane protein